MRTGLDFSHLFFKKAAWVIDSRRILGYNIKADENADKTFYGKGECNMVVTKESIIGDVLDYDRETAQFFFAIGMHCLGCPASRGESIADACAVHGTDADELVDQLNRFLASKQ